MENTLTGRSIKLLDGLSQIRFRRARVFVLNGSREFLYTCLYGAFNRLIPYAAFFTLPMPLFGRTLFCCQMFLLSSLLVEIRRAAFYTLTIPALGYDLLLAALGHLFYLNLSTA
jgi:hypothetical protein